MPPHPFNGEQQQDGKYDEKSRHRQDRRTDLLTDAGPHLARNRTLFDCGLEQYHDHFIEGRCESEERPEITPGAISGS